MMSNESEKSVSDELLSAYLDGELSNDDAARLEQQISESPKTEARLTELEKADSAVSEAVRAINKTSVPAKVMAMIAASKAEAALAQDQKTVVPFSRVSRLSKGRTSLTQIAAAASIALIAGLGAGILLPRPAAPIMDAWAELGPVAEGSVLFMALENNPSGLPAPDTGALTLTATPIMTFQTDDGATCREFSLSGVGTHQQGIACRDENTWLVQFAVAGGPPDPIQSEVYTPASSSTAALDSFLNAIKAGEPLGLEQEWQLIRDSWSQ